MDERLDTFKTLTGISSFLSEKQKFSTLFGTCSFILFFRCLVVNPIKLALQLSTSSYKTSKEKDKRQNVQKSVENFCFSDKKDDTPDKVLNASKCSSIAEDLVNNSTWQTVII